MTRNGVLIGRVQLIQHVWLNGLDASFITLEGATFNNTTPRGLVSTMLPHIVVGLSAHSIGTPAGGGITQRMGSVSAIGLTERIACNYSGLAWTVTNAIRVNFGVLGGESGGLVYTDVISMGWRESGLIGVIVGSDNVTFTIVSRADNINRTIGLVIAP